MLHMDDPSQSSVEAIASTFAALGQPSRLKILRLLLSAHPKGLPAGEIQKELDISASTLSHHLDKLRQVGVVISKKERQWIWYSVNAGALKHLIDFLFEECCTRNHVVSLDAIEPVELEAATTDLPQQSQAAQDAECCD